jgi:outer membrane protein OmpA-like peptidoglycan-associated protein
MMLGELFSRQKRYAEAAENYRTAVKLDSLFYRPVFFNLATSEMLSGDYSNALIHFQVYIEQSGVSERNKITAAKNIKNCEFALEAMKNPVSFTPISVGPGINTPDDEYWPSITADGQTMMFTRQAAADNPFFNRSHEDFYISRKTNDVWGEAFNAGAPLNTPMNEGAQSLSADGRYMYFTACDRPGGVGSCDIYFSANVDGRWTIPYNIGPPVNTPQWESQPSISPDGNMLFFSSSRPGGFGGKDIWYSVLDDNHKWKQPVNLGENVNTEGDETSPFIHFDGQTLYFSSDGHVGMGGFDIYMTKMNKDTTWTKPVNLGYPINTYNDETGLVVESNGRRAYFSSVRDQSNGKDIFYFDLDESIRPNPVSYLRGRVFDRETGGMIRAEYELINLTERRVVMSNFTDTNGDFLVCLPSGFNYGINVNKEGYLFYSENFLLEGVHSVVEPYVKNILLTRIKAGETMRLTNVFFDTDSWQIKEESFDELNNLVRLLSENTNIVMEIGGHTDLTGSAEHNITLSERRALSVVEYLISKGISANKLRHKGYGNTQPVGDNNTDEGRQLNRRTEAKVINAGE